jgi:hypothetical protein
MLEDSLVILLERLKSIQHPANFGHDIARQGKE